MNGNTGLRLRTDFSKRAGGNRGAYRKGMNMQGLGGPPESILTTSDPVGVYVGALQTLFASDVNVKDTPGDGRWDYATHRSWMAWLTGVFGAEDVSRFPAWGEDPGFTAYFIVDMFFGGFDLDRSFDAMKPFYAALGLPTTSRGEALAPMIDKANAERMRQVLDRVVRYVIGCEGGVAYGAPAVQTEGIVAGALAFAGSVAGILLVG